MIIVITGERIFPEIEGYLFRDIVQDNSTFVMKPIPTVYLTNQEPEEPVQPPDEPLFPPEEPPIETPIDPPTKIPPEQIPESPPEIPEPGEPEMPEDPDDPEWDSYF